MRIIQSDYPRPLNLLAIGPNGLVAAASHTFGAPGDVEVWEVSSGRLLQTLFEPDGAAASVALTLDGKFLLKSAGPYGVSICQTDGWRFRKHPEFDLRIRRAEFSLAASSNPLLVTDNGNWMPGRVSCWRLDYEEDSEPQLLWQQPAKREGRVGTPAVNRVGTRIAVVDRYDGSDGRPRQDVSLRDATTGWQLVRFSLDPASPVQQLAFGADGAKLLVRTESNKVQLFDTATGAAAGELAHKGRPFVTGIAVHPRGPVACARTDGTVTFWDVEKREQIRTLDWKAGRLVSVAFSPDGALAAAGTEEGKIVVWDVDL